MQNANNRNVEFYLGEKYIFKIKIRFEFYNSKIN